MTTNQFSIDGSPAIVTGASGGIGETIARRFLEDDVDVTICSRSIDRVGPVAEELNNQSLGGRAHPVECDIRDREAVESMVEETHSQFGPVKVLVNNAGASFMAPFEDISPNGWSTIIEINLNGTYNCIQAVEESMKNQDGGTIINISSVAGLRGSPYMSHYGSAKAGVINLTRTLSEEWAEHGIRINCVAPGLVATEGVEEQMDLDLGDYNRDEVDRGVGLTEEIADVVQFLASPASSFIIGETLAARGVPQNLETEEG